MSYPEITFRGRYAKMIKELTSDTPMHPKLFPDYYSAYLFGSVYGVLKGCREEYNPERDKDDSVDPATIKSQVLSNRSAGRESYDVIRKIVLFTESSRGLSFKEKIDYILRFDLPYDEHTPQELLDKSKYDQNTELFNQYALGGISLIYEKLTAASSREDLIQIMLDIKEEYMDAIQM